MIADIQILRDHVKRVGLSYIFRCLSVTSFLLWGAPCHEWTLGFPKWNISAFSTRKGSCKVSKKMEDRLCRETKLVPGQNHTGRELLGCSEIICSAPQPQGRLSSALVLPSGCCPAVKSYRETGSFLPSGLSCPQSQILFLFLLSDLSVSSALQIHGLSALVATERRLVHVLQVCKSMTEVCWTSVGELQHFQWPEGVQGSALSPPVTEKSLGTTPACDLPSCCLCCRSRTYQQIRQVSDHFVSGVCIFFIQKL